jgi:hypothetical protein
MIWERVIAVVCLLILGAMLCVGSPVEHTTRLKCDFTIDLYGPCDPPKQAAAD